MKYTYLVWSSVVRVGMSARTRLPSVDERGDGIVEKVVIAGAMVGIIGAIMAILGPALMNRVVEITENL